MTLEQAIHAEPIALPENPYLSVYKRFGRDELIALSVNLAGTAFAEYVMRKMDLSPAQRALAFSIAGPFVEKIGFFPAHIWDAYRARRAVAPHMRRPFRSYLSEHLAEGKKSLIEDVTMHDPIYALLLGGTKWVAPDTPAIPASFVSFMVAAAGVGVISVAKDEYRHRRYKARLVAEGFGEEFYFESRFVIRSNSDAQALTERLAEQFALHKRKRAQYTDNYFESTAPNLSGRRSHVRIRDRKMDDGKHHRTAQIVFSRASELAKQNEQFRYFPQRKEKMYCSIPAGMSAKEFGGTFSKAAGTLMRTVSFTRSMAYEGDLLMAVDVVEAGNPFYLLELKTFGDPVKLKEAMKYVMNEFPVQQTTYNKHDLARYAT
jgi:hypothetical protein